MLEDQFGGCNDSDVSELAVPHWQLVPVSRICIDWETDFAQLALSACVVLSSSHKTVAKYKTSIAAS
jgi:hypothetical protein